jgi:glycerol-3-phosphate acyltransferase PlsY
MGEVIIAIVICLLSYFLGCFSTARVLAKSAKNLRISKVGTGLADTENIYTNVSKTLGVQCAVIDFGKMVAYLLILRYFFDFFGYQTLASDIMIFAFGLSTIIGHCLPVTHSFKGGRGIFSYIGLLSVFIPFTMLFIVFGATLIFIFFKQSRFVQYSIVLLPPIVSYFLVEKDLLTLMVVSTILMGLINIILSKRLGEL